MRSERGTCLAIGGFDPSGGAGVTADAEAIAAFGIRPLLAVTTVTAQGPRRFRAAWPVPPAALRSEVRALMADFPVAAVKVGAMPTARHAAIVAAAIRDRGLPVVVDPVLGASRGPGLVGRSVRRALLDHLVPLASIVTPNAPEASALAGLPVRDRRSAEAAARVLLAAGAAAVLVKGGHLGNAGDLLATPLRTRWLPVHRVAGLDTHGTGCALAAGIAAGLAAGSPLLVAVRRARALVARGLRSARVRRAGWGPDLLGMRIAERR